jgi:hypothetical protein
MPTVKVDLNNFPKGAKVGIPYLGEFENGTTTEVSQKVWDRYKRLQPGASKVEGDHLDVVSDPVVKQDAAVIETETLSVPAPQEENMFLVNEENYSG